MIFSILEEKYSPSEYRYYIPYARFNNRYQFPYESSKHYFNDLVKILFENHIPDSFLANHFIWGLEDRELSKRLETIPDITSKLALMFATYSENAKQSFKFA
ncbi:hypothetical protein M0804_013269 [Polistes exclamans]|nr:hypothetical protein M0804_013269 [Polistes exclamans]